MIGVGNSAMDVARTALRHGARRVRLYARTREVHASTEELDYARLEGAEIVYGHRIVELTDAGPLFEVTEYDEAGAVLGRARSPCSRRPTRRSSPSARARRTSSCSRRRASNALRTGFWWSMSAA